MDQQTLSATAPATSNSALKMLTQLGKVFAYEKTSAMDPKRAQRVLKNASVLVSCTAAFYWIMLYPNLAMDRVYNSLLFLPAVTSPQTTSIDGIPIENVTFKSQNGARLHGWYIYNPKSTKTVLFSHGNGGNMDSFVPSIEAAVRAGASVFAYDYQGYGGSEGKPSLDGIVQDAQAAYDYLVNIKKIAKDRIVLFGQSMGTGVSCQLLKTRSVAAIILMSPYTSIVNVAREHLAWLNLYPDFAFPKQNLNTQEVLASLHPQTLIIHGELDETVQVHHSKQLAASSSNPIEVMFVPNAGHNDLLSVAGQQIIRSIGKYVN